MVENGREDDEVGNATRTNTVASIDKQLKGTLTNIDASTTELWRGFNESDLGTV